MLPMKRNLSEVHDSNLSSDERASDTRLSDSGKRRKHAHENTMVLRKDSYCWICHKLGHDVECNTPQCQRVYHGRCFDKSFSGEGCPECRQHTNTNKFLTDNLEAILAVALKECCKKFKCPDKGVFFRFPIQKSRELVRIIDLEIIHDNIKYEDNHYKSLAEFLSDVKWLHHNFCVMDGEDSPLAKDAAGFVRTVQKEIADIEDCPMCYYNLLVQREETRGNFFLKICEPPHDIVWAKLKGSPHWPAKCLRVVNGKASVRFFFTHDKSNVILDNKKCFYISLFHPEHKNSKITDERLIPKKREYKEAVRELLSYIKLYERKLEERFIFHDVGTPYPYKIESVKPNRRKKTMTSEESVPSLPPPEDVLNDTSVSEGNSSAAIEEAIHTSEKNTNISETVAMDSSSQFGGVDSACTSPVLSASMICEVAGSSEAQTTYMHSLPTRAEFSQPSSQKNIATTDFQSLISTSSPIMAASSSFSNFPGYFGIPRPRTPSSLADTVSSQENNGSYSDSQQLTSVSEGFASGTTESVPLEISPVPRKITNQEEDVIFLSSNPRSENVNFNPSVALPYIFHNNKQLEDLFNDGRYVFDSLFLRCWAFASRYRTAPELITNLLDHIRKLNSETKRLIKDNRTHEVKYRFGEEARKDLEEENKELKSLYSNLTLEFAKMKKERESATANAQLLFRSLHKQFQKSLEVYEKEISLEKDEMVQERDTIINSMSEEIAELKEEIIGLETKHAEAINKYEKLVNILKIEKEMIVQETKKDIKDLIVQEAKQDIKDRISQQTLQEVKDMIAQYLNEIKLSQKSEAASSDIETHERNQPIISGDERNSTSRKSTRRNPSETERVNVRTETKATFNQQICRQEIQTVTRKTSNALLLERTVKTSTTRNEGKIMPYNAPIYGRPFDPSTSPGCIHHIPPPIVPYGTGFSPFNLPPPVPNFDISSTSGLPNPHARESHSKESKKKQPRFTE